MRGRKIGSGGGSREREGGRERGREGEREGQRGRGEGTSGRLGRRGTNSNRAREDMGGLSREGAAANKSRVRVGASSQLADGRLGDGPAGSAQPASAGASQPAAMVYLLAHHPLKITQHRPGPVRPPILSPFRSQMAPPGLTSLPTPHRQVRAGAGGDAVAREGEVLGKQNGR